MEFTAVKRNSVFYFIVIVVWGLLAFVSQLIMVKFIASETDTRNKNPLSIKLF